MKDSAYYSNITARDILNESYVHNLMLKDYAYQAFKHDRGSPTFFEAKKRDLFAIVRQLSRLTISVSVSPAETRWSELL